MVLAVQGQCGERGWRVSRNARCRYLGGFALAAPIVCPYWVLDVKEELSADAVGKFITRLRGVALIEDCWTRCCLQRSLWQLELDAGPEGRLMIQALRVPGDRLHGHCSCRPCGPNESTSAYLQETLVRPAWAARRLTVWS